MGASVPKRWISSAVRRNYVKRLIRERFRRAAEALGSQDVVVIVNKSVPLQHRKIWSEVINKAWDDFIGGV